MPAKTGLGVRFGLVIDGFVSGVAVVSGVVHADVDIDIDKDVGASPTLPLAFFSPPPSSCPPAFRLPTPIKLRISRTPSADRLASSSETHFHSAGLDPGPDPDPATLACAPGHGDRDPHVPSKASGADSDLAFALSASDGARQSPVRNWCASFRDRVSFHAVVAV